MKHALQHIHFVVSSTMPTKGSAACVGVPQ